MKDMGKYRDWGPRDATRGGVKAGGVNPGRGDGNVPWMINQLEHPESLAL